MTTKDETVGNDQRRLSLLNDPNYGTVLSCLEKFRSILDLPNYSFQHLENHLLHSHERIPPRLIDFHFLLLKRLSLAKNTQRDKFDSIITKFASRFDLNDSEHLTTNGYLQTDIQIKIRILKNLLESQFDLNQTFKNTLLEQSARDLKCTSLGRDRFGVSYWFFMDTDCFVRLFREDTDLDRTWTHVAKDRDELEQFIRLLITDSVVRTKFPDWNIDYEPYISLAPTDEFQQRYLPIVVDAKTEDEDEQSTSLPKSKRARVQDSTKVLNQRRYSIDFDEEAMKKKRGRPSASRLSSNADKTPSPIEIKQELEPMSTDDEPKKRKRGRPKASTKLSEPNKCAIQVQIKQEPVEPSSNDDESARKRPGRPRKLSNKDKRTADSEAKPTGRRARKAKIVIDENPRDDDDDESQTQENPPVDETQCFVRRSSRPRKIPTVDPWPLITSESITPTPRTKKKRSINAKLKPSAGVSLPASCRPARRRKAASRRNVDDRFCLSSSSSDEHLDYLSDNEYDSDDYLPDSSQLDAADDHLFDLEEEETNVIGEELRTAKTAQASTIVTACCVCSKSDRPEVLLLCDDCDDAYHIECLRPALVSVPDGDWFCPLCEHKKLSNQLINKLKELLVHYHRVDEKRVERAAKQGLPRKIQRKEYSSDESLTAPESEDEQLDQQQPQEEESMLSASQTNENSNLSSSNIDELQKNISQRGRHRRTRFDMNKMLNDRDGSDDDSDTGDDEYIENTPQIANFDVQLPKKMSRLLHQRFRPPARTDAPARPRCIRPRLCHTTLDLNENLDSPLVYVNGDAGASRPIKSVVTNSKQTLKIVRRWNDVQRRSRLKSSTTKSLLDTTSDCADENSVFCPDDTSPPRSNESHNHHDPKEEDSTIIRSKVTLVQPVNLLPMYQSSTRNLVRKNDVNFDRLTRDIQYAVTEANTLSKPIDQQQVKRIQRTNFSPYLTKSSLRPLPVLLPKPTSVAYKIFKSKDPPGSMPTTTDLSAIILTPSSSSSLLDTNEEQSASTMNT